MVRRSIGLNDWNHRFSFMIQNLNGDCDYKRTKVETQCVMSFLHNKRSGWK